MEKRLEMIRLVQCEKTKGNSWTDSQGVCISCGKSHGSNTQRVRAGRDSDIRETIRAVRAPREDSELGTTANTRAKPRI